MLLARTVTPEPMRPGWAKALAMSASALPHRGSATSTPGWRHAAARPVIVPDTIVIDHGKVFVSRNFRASCRLTWVSALQPAHQAHRDRQAAHRADAWTRVASLFAQFVAGYLGRSRRSSAAATRTAAAVVPDGIAGAAR